MIKTELASMLDHTILKPDATNKDIEKLCREAITYQMVVVCVNPSWVALAAGLVRGTETRVATVVGFPLGANISSTKALETRDVIKAGASEVDMVINLGALKSGHTDLVREDIAAIVATAREENPSVLVKVIIETCLLTEFEKVLACQLAVEEGAHFVKTSTGFSTGGATLEDVRLMRETVGPNIGVKASGGIRDLSVAMDMIKAGANRIGTSSGVVILQGLK
ncbi:MAG: deoxyribose-phosphate aldolase [Thermincolia bacterium]